jgi:hypothetical protein
MQETNTLPFPTITGVWERRREAGWKIKGNIKNNAPLPPPLFVLVLPFNLPRNRGVGAGRWQGRGSAHSPLHSIEHSIIVGSTSACRLEYYMLCYHFTIDIYKTVPSCFVLYAVELCSMYVYNTYIISVSQPYCAL